MKAQYYTVVLVAIIKVIMYLSIFISITAVTLSFSNVAKLNRYSSPSCLSISRLPSPDNSLDRLAAETISPGVEQSSTVAYETLQSHVAKGLLSSLEDINMLRMQQDPTIHLPSPTITYCPVREWASDLNFVPMFTSSHICLFSRDVFDKPEGTEEIGETLPIKWDSIDILHSPPPTSYTQQVRFQLFSAVLLNFGLESNTYCNSSHLESHMLRHGMMKCWDVRIPVLRVSWIDVSINSLLKYIA